MIEESLAGLYNQIDRLSRKRLYLPLLISCCVLAILFFSTPRLFTQGMAVFEAEWWDAVMRKSVNLIDPLTHIDPTHHAAKKVFRLTVPVFAKLLFLNPFGIYLLQCASGIALLIYSYKLIFRDTADAVISTFGVIGICFVYFGKVSFVDILSTFDGFSFLFLILAMYAQKTFWIFIWCWLAAWNDERACVALLIVTIYHSRDFLTNKTNLLNVKNTAVVLGAISYLLLRFFVGKLFHIHTPTGAVGLDVIINNIPNMGFGIWTAFEGYWLLFPLVIYYLFKTNKLAWSIYLITILLFILLGLIIYDITRGESYLFPMFFCILPIVQNSFTSSFHFRSVLFAATCINFLFPAYYIIGPGINMYQPIYFDFLYYIRNLL
jgi:hypothetical protein